MKKIMFNDNYGLTKAVLEGRKTQTRRIINQVEQMECLPFSVDNFISFADKNGNTYQAKSRYAVGEKVAVAQSYKDAGCDFYFHRGLAGWNNKMFVRPEEMPHRIRITNIRVERLRDICEEDCLKEGIEQCDTPTCHKHYCTRDCGDCAPSPREAFAILINKVSGKGTWENNPWVFVYDFELIK